MKLSEHRLHKKVYTRPDKRMWYWANEAGQYVICRDGLAALVDIPASAQYVWMTVYATPGPHRLKVLPPRKKGKQYWADVEGQKLQLAEPLVPQMREYMRQHGVTELYAEFWYE